MKDPMFCEHANENPAVCQCPSDCYCKAHTCAVALRDRPITAADLTKALREIRNRYCQKWGDTVLIVDHGVLCQQLATELGLDLGPIPNQ
jgi:hypothetical protein